MEPASIKLVEASLELLRSAGYYVDNLWHVDDIHFICEQQSLGEISNEEAKEVFKIAKDQFEGEVGLSWPKLEKAVRTYLQRRQILTTIYEPDNSGFQA